MTTDKIPVCHYCSHSPFTDWLELAKHIAVSRKGHRAGKRWAHGYIIGDRLKKKKEYGHQPLTAEQKASKNDMQRELSGVAEIVNTICLKGKHTVRQCLPVEYTYSPDAWRIQGHLIVLCADCKTR